MEEVKGSSGLDVGISTMQYSKGDCSYFRYRILSMIAFTGRMGEGERFDIPLKNEEFQIFRHEIMYNYFTMVLFHIFTRFFLITA